MIGKGRLQREIRFLQIQDDTAAKAARICLIYLVLLLSSVVLGRVAVAVLA